MYCLSFDVRILVTPLVSICKLLGQTLHGLNQLLQTLPELNQLFLALNVNTRNYYHTLEGFLKIEMYKSVITYNVNLFTYWCDFYSSVQWHKMYNYTMHIYVSLSVKKEITSRKTLQQCMSQCTVSYNLVSVEYHSRFRICTLY